MKHLLSPHYTHEKLENPTIHDLIDVYEDLWVHYVFSPVELLMKSPYGDVAAMTILCSYFEVLESLTTGESSNNKSKEFFVKGFIQVFQSESPQLKEAAQEIYKYIRCGLAHEGMLRQKVYYSRGGCKVFFLTYPKKANGNLDTSKGAQSIVVNPIRMYQSVKEHFNSLVKKLRENNHEKLNKTFVTTIERQWGLNDNNDILAAMTEDEFLGNA